MDTAFIVTPLLESSEYDEDCNICIDQELIDRDLSLSIITNPMIIIRN